MNVLAARATRSPIGLDLGARSIKAAQLVRGAHGFRLAAAIALPRLDPGPVLSQRDADRLGPALTRAGFRGRRLAAALPAEIAVHASIELPGPGSKAPLDQIAAGELARASGAEAGSLVCAHWPTSTVGPHEAGPARVVGAGRDRIEALLDSLRQVRCDAGPLLPLALDTGPWALVRCVAPWLGEATDVTVIADIGWRRAALTIAQGQRIIYERQAAGVGVEPLQAGIARDLPAPPDAIDRLLERLEEDAAPDGAGMIARAAIRRQGEQLGAEVERSLRFAAEQGAEGAYRLILAGGGASPAMAEAVTGPLDGLAEVRRATPGELLAGASPAAADDPRLIGAIGLAMRMDR